ncbi:MAG: flagellar hook-associated protein FlgL [SAR324 cluster bacterium]|nr:flagellar hook-associated protein FlgL [SAR324 cluster bacterium]
MRVTDLTKQNNVVRNIQTAEAKIQSLQGDISSGKRIVKISDDPIGATQAMDFRTRIEFMNTLQRNIRDDFVWMDRTEALLADVGDKLRRTKNLILSQANATGDDASRRVTATEIKAIADSMVQAGNSKIGKLFIFSGSKTFTQSLRKMPDTQQAVVRFEAEASEENGEQAPARDPALAAMEQGMETELAHFEGHSGNSYIMRVTKPGAFGRAHVQISDDGGKTWSRDKTLLSTMEMVNEDGKASDKVMLQFNLPERAADEPDMEFPEGMEFIFRPNPSVTYQGNQDQRLVRTGEGVLLPLNVTAEEIFFHKEGDPDTVNIFDLLETLKRGLEENDQGILEERLGDIDKAFEQVLEVRANTGAVRKEMEDRLDRLGDREFSKIKQLSDIEDLNMAEAVVDMNLADARNRAALDTSARLLQPSLLNFLR